MSDDVVGAMSGAAERLAEACTAAGVEHLVFLSISNIDKPELDQFPYYLAKREQEGIVRDGPPVGHHRSLDAVVRIRYQPVSSCRDRRRGGSPGLVDSTDRCLVDEASARDEFRWISGPDVIALPDLTARVLTVKGDNRPVVTLPAVIESLSRGVLLAPSTAEHSRAQPSSPGLTWTPGFGRADSATATPVPRL